MLYDKKWDQKQQQSNPGRRLLLAAANYIEEHGWCQGALENINGQVCLVGALDKTKDYNDQGYYPAILAIQDIIGPRFGEWNDQPGRTKEDVVNLLRQVAHNV
jgi:hypothetical protein